MSRLSWCILKIPKYVILTDNKENLHVDFTLFMYQQIKGKKNHKYILDY